MEFHDIDISFKEEAYVLDALRHGHISGRGPNTRAVEVFLQDKLDASRVLMTTSCTHALEMAVRLGGLGQGDEVLVPSYTFPSTANAVLAVGAQPVLIPTDEKTLCVSLDIVKRHRTDKTKAVIAVHYGGICHDLDALADHCKKEGILLIEDAAQAYGSIYKNRYLGTFGDFGCYSFHGTKNDVAGEGGALVINTDSHCKIQQAERLLEKGTDRLAFLRGEANKYEWKGYGSSYVPSDILMALLRGQLERAQERMEKRRDIIKTYTRAFSCFETDEVFFFKGFLNERPSNMQVAFEGTDGLYKDKASMETCVSNGHLYYVVFQKPETGRRFHRAMSERGIPLRKHFVPLHMSEMGRSVKFDPVALAPEDTIFDRLYRLPVHSKLSDKDVEKIIEATRGALKSVLETSVF